MIPKLISFRKAKAPRHGVIAYAKFASRSRSDIVHTVTVRRRGDGFALHCSCEDAAFRTLCDHKKIARRRLARVA